MKRLEKRRLAGALILGSTLGCGNPAGVELDGLPEGAEVEPGGKADGELQVIFVSAPSAVALAYADPSAADEVSWSAAELDEIFANRMQPGSAAEAPWSALRRGGALGYYGPLGPYGPLGVFGPVGQNVWNPSVLISGSVPWNELALTDGGPLSADGPLGVRGPLNVETWGPFEAAWDLAHPSSIHAVHLRPGGVFAMLGQTGPLSAVGPLGPLGPVGGHGFVRNDQGAFEPEGDACTLAPEGREAPPCRAVEIDFDGDERRTYGLVEFYPAKEAASIADNDASFVAQGSMMPGDEAARFEFTSTRDQWVSVLVLPEFAKYPPFQAAFDLPGLDGSGAGAITFQLADADCDTGALLDAVREASDALTDADSFEEYVEAFSAVNPAGLASMGRCNTKVPDTIFVRHALYPWRSQVSLAQFNPFLCNPATFFSNPWCRATGLSDVFEVDYDHRSSFDDFDLRLDVEDDTIISDSADTLDWVHIRVAAGTRFRASVQLASTWEVTDADEDWGLDLFIESAQWADAFTASDVEFFGRGSKTRPVPRYRLIVVGSTEYAEASDVTFAGPYLSELR